MDSVRGRQRERQRMCIGQIRKIVFYNLKERNKKGMKQWLGQKERVSVYWIDKQRKRERME